LGSSAVFAIWVYLPSPTLPRPARYRTFEGDPNRACCVKSAKLPYNAQSHQGIWRR
jgi:hypothetical protein